MRMLCGLLSPTSGSAEVAGFDVARQPDRIKEAIGYMSQRFSLYPDLTVRENIRFYGGIYGLSGREIKARTVQLLDQLMLGEVADEPVRRLPLGWKQKLAFSVALVHRPAIVFLDEPTGGVDPVSRRNFWEMIYAAAHEGTTVFVTTHYMDEAEYCDRISMMVDGESRPSEVPVQLRWNTRPNQWMKFL
jgi:ABC-2 type transport system ATP-binding protein